MSESTKTTTRLPPMTARAVLGQALALRRFEASGVEHLDPPRVGGARHLERLHDELHGDEMVRGHHGERVPGAVQEGPPHLHEVEDPGGRGSGDPGSSIVPAVYPFGGAPQTGRIRPAPGRSHVECLDSTGGATWKEKIQGRRDGPRGSRGELPLFRATRQRENEYQSLWFALSKLVAGVLSSSFRWTTTVPQRAWPPPSPAWDRRLGPGPVTFLLMTGSIDYPSAEKFVAAVGARAEVKEDSPNARGSSSRFRP